jgi:hypothetical protein
MSLRIPLPAACVALCLASAAFGGCPPADPGVPLDELVFFTGMAVAGDRLLVVSSDFDLSQDEGALLAADLAAVRAATEPSGPDDVVQDAYVEAAVLPSFGDRPVVTSGGERVYVPTRAENRVVALDIAEDGTLSCPETEPVDDKDRKERPRPVAECGHGTSAMQLPVNDPYDVLLLQETPPFDERFADPDAPLPLLRVDGLIATQSSPFLFFFSDDVRRDGRDGADRLQVTSSIELPEIFGGVRGAALRPAQNGSDTVVIAAADLSRELDLFGARLIVFAPDSGAFGDDGAGEGELKSFDVTLVTGSFSMRDVVLVPGDAASGEDDDQDDALVVILRDPDAIARFAIDDVGGLPDLRLTAVASTCKSPTSLARATLRGPSAPASGDVERVLVACHDGNVVEAIDPHTLRTTDAVRFAGRGPYDVVVHEAPAAEGETTGPLDVYVSFFLDGSVGAMRFVDGKLEATGRIGVADERPEDGRE